MERDGGRHDAPASTPSTCRIRGCRNGPMTRLRNGSPLPVLLDRTFAALRTKKCFWTAPSARSSALLTSGLKEQAHEWRACQDGPDMLSGPGQTESGTTCRSYLHSSASSLQLPLCSDRDYSAKGGQAPEESVVYCVIARVVRSERDHTLQPAQEDARSCV
ncbi:hypothetical protein BC628DRAFT_1379185 [Trametes gibbosa]|nr:hypothetical protein BC628DRAFT_1379185 [Trametes gibbosa]